MKQLIMALLMCLPYLGMAQAEIRVINPGVSVNDNGNRTPSTSAVLDVNSNSKGVIFPRLTSAQRDAMTDLEPGILIFNLDDLIYQYWNGLAWYNLGVPIELEAPIAPSDLVTSNVTTSDITLSWIDNSSNETVFEVHRSTDGVNFSSIVTLDPNTVNYTDTGLSSLTRYFYKVVARNISITSESSTISEITQGILEDAYVAFSLRRLTREAIYAVQIRRSSDNTSTNVLLPGNGTEFLSLSWEVEAGGTLRDWIGTDDGFISVWHDQTISNGANNLTREDHLTPNQQPRIIQNGVIEQTSQYGIPGIYFGESPDIKLRGGFQGIMGPGNTFTVFAVGNAVNGDYSSYITTSPNTGSGQGFKMGFGYSNTTIVNVTNTSQEFTRYNAAAAQNSDSPRHQTAFHNGSSSSVSVWENSVAGDQNSPYSGTYYVDDFWMGRDRANGGVQSDSWVNELIIFDLDKTSDRTNIETNQAAAWGISN